MDRNSTALLAFLINNYGLAILGVAFVRDGEIAPVMRWHARLRVVPLRAWEPRWGLSTRRVLMFDERVGQLP